MTDGPAGPRLERPSECGCLYCRLAREIDVEIAEFHFAAPKIVETLVNLLGDVLAACEHAETRERLTQLVKERLLDERLKAALDRRARRRWH